MEVDNGVWDEDEDDELIVEEINDVRDVDMRNFNQLLAKGKTDLLSIVEYTVTVYYTRYFVTQYKQCTNLNIREVKKTTPDLETFIDQVIAETNDGYKNSGVPLRVKLHCLLESDIPDGMSGVHSVMALARSKVVSLSYIIFLH